MNATLILSVIAAYFGVLFMISRLTGKKADENTFFKGNKSSPWYLVAFGMIGASLSGVTFISVPGKVGLVSFSYFQIVIGYFFGYLFVAYVLMPLYYKRNLTSIYAYLGERFGSVSHKTGAFFFLLSRTLGAAIRLYLVALVLDTFVFGPLGIPFAVTVGISIGLIWLYTFRGGIKTVVWTDTLQTTFMLLAAGLTIYFILSELDWSLGTAFAEMSKNGFSKTFFWDPSQNNYFFRFFIAGMLLTIGMTGVDQDMMQKNLTCRSLKEAQKNMLSMSAVLVLVNFVILILGGLLYLYGMESGAVELASSQESQIILEGTAGANPDTIFPTIALNYLPTAIGVLFILGLIAAAYSSADSALTSLTTSFCIDFLDFDKKPASQQKTKLRYGVHIGFSVLLLIVILLLKAFSSRAVIDLVLLAGAYSYAPLIALFVWGLFTSYQIRDRWVPFICVAAPALTWILNLWLGWGLEVMAVDILLALAGLAAISKKASVSVA